MKLSDILIFLNIKEKLNNDIIINKINNLKIAQKRDLSFFSNIKYLDQLKKTKSSACLIQKKYVNFIPKNCYPIISENPQLDFIKISNLFYKNLLIDKINQEIMSKKEIKIKFKKISFGKNFICEKNVKIGKNVSIGHNVVIKDNTTIDDNVVIGSNVIISHSIIEKNVNICDGSVIGKKGFGFKFHNGEVIRIPHIGKVIIKKNSEIGSNCNIDRGSISDTIIGENTFLDNQIQIAHNVKIGNFCMIAAQVGISGSTVIGNNVSIGGQSGISGHLKIGNNVKIGGKSGVLKNIDDNKTVMGYPAMEFRNFIKRNKSK